jgi:hypothetical protein
MSGKIHPKDMNKYIIQTPQSPVLERLQAAKQEIGDRLIIVSTPKYNEEHRHKGFRI